MAVVVFDFDYRRVYKRSEFRRQTVLKILIWIMFYATIAASCLTKNSGLYKIANFLMTVLPCVSIFYSYALWRFRFLTYPLNVDQDQFTRFERLINERSTQIDLRQRQFDERHFGAEGFAVVEIEMGQLQPEIVLIDQNVQEQRQNNSYIQHDQHC